VRVERRRLDSVSYSLVWTILDLPEVWGADLFDFKLLQFLRDLAASYGFVKNLPELQKQDTGLSTFLS
jgi:uncharacterized protein YihD (DUF1040 family)